MKIIITKIALGFKIESFNIVEKGDIGGFSFVETNEGVLNKVNKMLELSEEKND